MTENNPNPEVHVHKYCIVLDDDVPSSEELLYQKAEQKHLLIKKVERIMKEEAIDCALNMTGNMFKEEINENQNCGKGNKQCPAICDYTQCDYKCSNKKLNDAFYDAKNNTYRKLDKNTVDTTTFSHTLARNEIEFSKRKIKELFLMGYVYTIETIVNHVKSFYKEGKKDLFNEYYVYKGLDELIPISENDFNNFIDTVYDKYNRPGYLIYVNNFYIYQPIEQPENSPMYYRLSYDKYISNNISLRDYLKHTGAFNKFGDISAMEKSDKSEMGYDFDSVMEYYSSRKEFDIVGIIDKEPNKKKLKSFNELSDVFKMRERMKGKTNKKRGIGIQSLTGAVCANSQSHGYLSNILKKLKVQLENPTRMDMCNNIMEKLLFMEKYGTTKNNNKLTYVIIPFNHSQYQFPYNLEDRVQYITEKISEKTKLDISFKVNEEKSNNLPIYKIKFKDEPDLKDYDEYLKSLTGEKIKNEWVIYVK
jgi:hypothetical protein